jgi:hypothetical protein
MWQLIKIELFKIFRKPRTYISFGAIALMVLIVQIALKFDGRSYVEFVLGSLQENIVIPYEDILNGYFVCFVILNLLLIHIPLLIALVAGDQIAGEANMGTLRLLITRPVSRTELLLAKFIATVIYTILLLTFMALLALFLSILVFGTNDLIVARSSSIEIIARHDVMWRYMAAFGYAAIALTTVASLICICRQFYRSHRCHHQHRYCFHHSIRIANTAVRQNHQALSLHFSHACLEGIFLSEGRRRWEQPGRQPGESQGRHEKHACVVNIYFCLYWLGYLYIQAKRYP